MLKCKKYLDISIESKYNQIHLGSLMLRGILSDPYDVSTVVGRYCLCGLRFKIFEYLYIDSYKY